MTATSLAGFGSRDDDIEAKPGRAAARVLDPEDPFDDGHDVVPEREACGTATLDGSEAPEIAFVCAYCGGTRSWWNPSAFDNKGARCCRTTGCLRAEVVI